MDISMHKIPVWVGFLANLCEKPDLPKIPVFLFSIQSLHYSPKNWLEVPFASMKNAEDCSGEH